MNVESLAALLTRRVTGRVCQDEQSLVAASRDFGGTVQYRPQIVVWPESCEDIVAIVRTARETASRIAVRGAGHSQGGQALSQDGIVLEMQRLRGIEQWSDSGCWVSAKSGTLWSDLVDEALTRGLIPTVLTDHLKVTLGGTLSVGGLGPGSFRYGAQVDHCLGLEAVLGTGDVVQLDDASGSGMLDQFLGGLGRFGVLTRVQLTLRVAPHTVRTHYLRYDTAAKLLFDARLLMARDGVRLISGAAVPQPSTTGLNTHYYLLAVSQELGDQPDPAGQWDSSGLHATDFWHEDWTACDFFTRLDHVFDQRPRSLDVSIAHPWVEHLLPLSSAEEYVTAVAREFPTCPLLIWPMLSAHFRRPMLCLPASGEIVLVGLLCSPPRDELSRVLQRLKKIDELGTALGGKRYLSGWLDFDIARWRNHFGARRWQAITNMQAQCDPDGLFRRWEGTCER
jgi:FAD/FMN-containing dehydrogenase